MPNLRGKTWTTTTPAYVEDAQYWEDHLISDAAAAKAASSVQSVNNTAPDANGNVDIVALPSGGTAGQVLTKQSSTAGDADWEDPASYGGSIIVVNTTESSLYGQTVTITDGNTTISGTFDNSGVATFTGVTMTGTLTVKCLNETTTVSAPYFGNYSATITATVYGFHIDGTESVPTSNISYQVQYNGENVKNYSYSSAYMDYANSTFVYGDWTQNEFFMPKPVLLSQDAQTKIYLDPDDYTKDIDGNDVSSYLTGASGSYNAMMEWGRDGMQIWVKIVSDENYGADVYISDVQQDEDFHAYSFIGVDGNLKEHFYTPIYNGCVVSSNLRSISGQSIMNGVSGTTEITYATNNGAGYYTETFADRVLINLLLMLIGKSTNTQLTFGNGHYSGSSSGAESLLTTGTMNARGLFYGTNGTGAGVKVFGMENYWGNQWRRTAGLLNMSGTQKYKMTYPYNNDGTDYTTVSDGTPSGGTSGGYISQMVWNEDGFFTKTASGSATTFYADGMFYNNSRTDYALFGGACNNGYYCGAFMCSLNDTLSSAVWSFGAALSYHG